MKDKVCMVTGANSGIGKETALALAGMGATVVMVCRSAERGVAAQAEVIAQTGNDRVDLMLADLSVQDCIHDLADEFKRKYDRLDVLVNNAGAIFNDRQETADGLERTFALNHLAYFLLTQLLLDVLIDSAPARIVNVSSGAHHGASIKFDDLQLEDGYSSFRAYGQSKLANVLFTYELAERLAGTGVTVNAVHPGFVGSNFGQNDGGPMRWFMKVIRPFIRSPEKGAETVVYLATSPEVAGATGQYWQDKKPRRTSAASYDRETAVRLWQVSEQLTSRTAQLAAD